MPDDRSLLKGLVRGFVKGNYFYVISAALMMLGCFLLIRGEAVTPGAFVRTLKSLLILQGYEVLVIATGIFIVRRLRKLDDAFTLFAIEAVLLLDPTFFSNAFATLIQNQQAGNEAAMVNAICGMLVPLKLALLCAMLRIRITPLAWSGFLAAAFTVYAGSLLSVESFGLTMGVWIMSWTAPIIAMLLPRSSQSATIASGDASFATDFQRWMLPRFLVAIPLFTVTSHALESAFVHEVPLGFTILIPTFFMLAIRYIIDWDLLPGDALRAIDNASVASIIAAIPVFTPRRFPEALAYGTVAGVIIAAYLFVGIILRYRPAFLRLGVLGVVGVIITGIRYDWIRHGREFVQLHSAVLLGTGEVLGWILLVTVATALFIKLRDGWGTWLGMVIASGVAFRVAHITGHAIETPFITGVFFCLGIVAAMIHGNRTILWSAAAVGVLVMFLAAQESSAAKLSLQVFVGLAIPAALRLRAHGLFSLLSLLTLAWLTVRFQTQLGAIPLSYRIFVIGLMTFSIGVAITLSKERLLRWAEGEAANNDQLSQNDP